MHIPQIQRDRLQGEFNLLAYEVKVIDIGWETQRGIQTELVGTKGHKTKRTQQKLYKKHRQTTPRLYLTHF